MADFKIVSPFAPSTPQQNAIDKLTNGIITKQPYQTLLGITGSGKTFTMANVIQNIGRPTLILSHNKTLTAQLYHEFKNFFPDNAVEYFVSYYDYYQPEAYVPRSDIYIEKDASINERLDKLRLSATRSLFDREDVIIVSSVSCIYGLGSPEAYLGMMLYLAIEQKIDRDKINSKLIEIRYERNSINFKPGTFRAQGDTLDIFPAYDDVAVRVNFFDDLIEKIYVFDPLTGKKIKSLSKIVIYPASHYVQPKHMMAKTISMIKTELKQQLTNFRNENKLLEAQRLEQRTNYDMEMLAETGTCQGIENYSRIMTRRDSGQPPPTLIDYFPANSLLFIDESHVTLPQVHGMYKGDYARKKNLTDYGFRLPSAIDNRPLTFNEFENSINQTIYVSATPGNYELEKSNNNLIEQIIRPTGLLDPKISVRPIRYQVDDLLGEIKSRVAKSERVLITTLTKKMAEDLTDYYHNLSVKVRYMHSDIDAIERSEILRDLRLGVFDVLVGINLLREGLDLPEVSLVAILDADKEGFLRSTRSLLQTCGRAARNVSGSVIMYADRITDSIDFTIKETDRRRKIQLDYNLKHNIIPKTIVKPIPDSLRDKLSQQDENKPKESFNLENMEKRINRLRKEMDISAKRLNFERAAELRDKIKILEESILELVGFS
ncbi:MAG: excinuclease ABC subunit UvrB [SAR324 cluster bacterium]|nr:excinuclease ABC subunit UvrB [SAR324 cluster bacterium]